MEKKLFFLALTAISLMVLTACAPRSVVQVNEPPPEPAPGGSIDVPGVRINVYAPGPNPLVNTPDAHGRPAGFWLGLWHGIISPITLIVALVSGQNVQTYEVHNVGTMYNLGHLLGVLVMPAVFGLVFGWRH